MNDFKAIEKHIRDAHLQRSAAIGAALGEFLANVWLGTAELLGRRPARPAKPASSY